MASSSMHPLGISVNEEITGESCRFKVLCSCLNLDNSIFFPAFNTGEHFWCIVCQPSQGNVEGEIGNLEFYFVYGGEWKDVKVTVELCVLKMEEALSSIKWITTTHTFPKCGECLTLKKTIQGDELRRYLKDDYFIVICNIKILSTGCLGGISILSSLSGTSKRGSIEVRSLENKDENSRREVKKDVSSGLVQFKVVCSYITTNNGGYVDFPMFTVGEHCWYIGCDYANGYLSFYLYIRSETKDLKAGVEFGMLKNDDTTSSFKWRSDTCTFKNCGAGIVMDKFIEGDELKQYLQDDYFRLICNITILSETITSDYDVTIISSTGKPMIYSVNGQSPFLHDDVSKLLQNKEMSDVTLEVNGENFHAHRLILAARSSVFKEELYGQTNQKNMENIKINGMERRVFKAMLHFIYTDMLPNLNEISDGRNKENNMCLVEMFRHLLVAADRYALERLKLICEDKLSNSITIDTVATTLDLAEKRNCPILKARCLEFLTSPQCLAKVALTEGYAELLMSCPTILKELRANFNNLSL